MKATFLLILAATICTGHVVFAQADRGPLEDRVLRNAQRVDRVLQSKVKVLPTRDLEQINRRLSEIISIVRGQNPAPRPRPRPVPPSVGLTYSADCHIDDDPDFTPGQRVVGRLHARDVRQLVDDCAALAIDAYGTRGSSGLLNLQLDESTVPRHYQAGICHLDDDIEFTTGQVVVGLLAAPTLADLIDQCDYLAAGRFPQAHSSAVLDLNTQKSAPRGYSQATCEIDDDPDFTPGQFRVGTVWGQSVTELSAQCRMVADHVYKGAGSSGISDLR